MLPFLTFLVRFEVIFVTMLAAIGVALPGLLAPVCLAAVLFWLPRRIVTGRWTVRTPVDMPALLLLSLLPLNFWISARPDISGPQALRLLLGILLFYALVNGVRSQHSGLWLYRGYLSAGLALVGVAFFSVDWTQEKLPFLPDALYSVFSNRLADTIHPNVLAGTLLPFALLAAARILWKPEGCRWDRLLAFAVFSGIFGMLILSQSRSALLAFGVSLLVLAAFRWRYGWAITGLAGGAALLYVASDPAGPRQFLFEAGLVGGLPGRVDIWERAILLIRDFPFTGTGMGHFHLIVSAIYPFFSPDPARVDHAHQLFLQVAVDLGIPGLIAWSSIFLGVLASAWIGYRRARNAENPLLMAMGAALIAVQVGLAVHGLFDAAIWGMVRSAPLVWGIWAGAMVALLVPGIAGEGRP